MPASELPSAILQSVPRTGLKRNASKFTSLSGLILRQCICRERIQLARCRVSFYLQVPCAGVKTGKPTAKLRQFRGLQLGHCPFDRFNGTHEIDVACFPKRLSREEKTSSPGTAAIEPESSSASRRSASDSHNSDISDSDTDSAACSTDSDEIRSVMPSAYTGPRVGASPRVPWTEFLDLVSCDTEYSGADSLFYNGNPASRYRVDNCKLFPVTIRPLGAGAVMDLSPNVLDLSHKIKTILPSKPRLLV